MASDSEVMSPRTLQLPASTASPVTLALGITLVFAGLVTSEAITILGVILCLVGAVGWFRDVLPQEAVETIAKSVKTILEGCQQVEPETEGIPMPSVPAVSNEAVMYV